jgi:predicted nucleic acid-binding protein
MEKVILDTNILIEILKGNEETIRTVEALSCDLAISSITAMELYYGALDKAETRKIEKFIHHFGVVYPDEVISRRATGLVKHYAKSHTLNIPDSIIAATALTQGHPLLTYNRKDFRFIEGLELVN